MQLVYSGGGSTPTPSPRGQRKHYGYGRPLMSAHSQGSTSQGHHRCTRKDIKQRSDNDSSLRDLIPAMKRSLAITCLVLNILLPGLGTFVSGFSVLCGSKVRFKDQSKQKIIWANTWVAFLQFVTAFLFLLGWIWSIVWGVAFITVSNDYFKNPRNKHRGDMSNKDLYNNVGVGMNRTGSSEGLAAACHLDKPKPIYRSSSADQPAAKPHSTLQKHISSQSESSLTAKKTATDAAKTRHLRHQKRQLSDHELSPLRVSQPERLEQIVIHDLPANPVRRGVLRRDATITSSSSDMDIVAT